jgi:predicted aconitase with swiveling domain
LANIPLIIITKEEFDSLENGKEIEIDSDSQNKL